MKEITIPAQLDQLDTVLDMINAELEARDCPMKTQVQIAIAAEEIFVNIAHYAYAPETGSAVVRCEVEGEPLTMTLCFEDEGTPYDPLSKADPDTSLSAEERQIGGLGIYMVKKSMDAVRYAREDGKNKLTLVKRL